ncbi:MAG: glucokinase [Holosporaceae bacterium]|jgi:glucokinase|nr:glucokinase [Rhodospirillaceae bacterium]
MPIVAASCLLKVKPNAERPTPFTLLARVGGMYARFGLLQENGQITDAHRLLCKDYPDMAEAVEEYYRLIELTNLPDNAVFAVSAPVRGDSIQLITPNWSFSVSELEKRLNFHSLTVINDFAAIGLALPYLGGGDIITLQEGKTDLFAPKIVLGATSGTGFAASLPNLDGSWDLVITQAGHTTLPAFNELEDRVLQQMRQRYDGHVSVERVLSDLGLLDMHRILSQFAEQDYQPLDVESIIERGLTSQCPVCAQTLQLFCQFLGTVASNYAMCYSAFGGVYIAGDLIPQFGKLLDQYFVPRFSDKGRFGSYMAEMPLYLITRTFPGLAGLRVLVQASGTAA